MYRSLLLVVITALISACATVPGPLEGEYSPLTPSQARNQVGVGEQVRWGGAIVSVEPLAEKTCIEVLSSELNARARPYGEGYDQGRFIACKSGFLDPATFEKGQQITVIGQVAGVETHPIGEYEYHYPVLDTRVVYLWPERNEYPRHAYRYYHPFLYDPFLWPYPYFHSYWGYYPYWRHAPKAQETVSSNGGIRKP